MITNVLLFVLVLLTEFHSEAAAKSHRTTEKEFVAESKERRNRDELTRIIKELNGDPRFDSYYDRNNNQGSRNHIERDKYEKVLNKKYINIKEYDYRSSEAEVRLHFIKNPEVLDRFVHKLRKDTSVSSSSSDSSDDVRRYAREAEAADVRRNAMFHVKASKEKKNDPLKYVMNNKFHGENAISFPPSIEDQVTPFKTHFVEDKNDANKKDSNLNVDNVTVNTKRFKIQSKRNKIKEKTTTESWDLGDTYDNNDDNNKNKEKANLWDKTEKVKDDKVKTVKKTNNDPWDMSSKKVKDRNQSKEKYNNGEWDKPAKRKEDKLKSEDNWGKPAKKKPKEEKFESEENIKNNRWDKPGRKKPKDNARYDNGERNANKKYNYDLDTEKDETKKKNGWNEPEKPFKQGRNKNFKDSKTYKDLWDSRDIDWKKKKPNSFEDTEPRKKTTKNIEPVAKKKVDWGAPINKKDIIDNDWDKVGRDWGKKPIQSEYTEKTTRGSFRLKKKIQNSYDRPSYVARIPEYNHKQQSHNSRIDVGGSFRGRTPIPFVGKRGIYDDK